MPQVSTKLNPRRVIPTLKVKSVFNPCLIRGQIIFSLIFLTSLTHAGITINDGTVTLSGSTVVNLNNGESYSQSGGTFNAGNANINVTGNMSSTGGTFNAQTSTVALNGTTAQDIIGAFTFNNFSILDTALRIVGFEEDVTQTVSGNFTVNLSVGQVVSIRTINSSGTVLNDGSQHTLNITGTIATIDFVDIRDTVLKESGADKIPALNPANSTDSGNESGWFNNAPTASTDSLERETDTPARILITTLTSNDSDTDSGDTLTLSLTTASSTNGGTISTSGPWVFYIPPSGGNANDADSFNYNLSDGNGGNATGVVSVTINTFTDPGNSNVASATEIPSSGGQVLIKFIGVIGRGYDIQASEDLMTWVVIETATADSEGKYTVTDEDAGMFVQRFYRGVKQ